jgi:uracil-DNA glycosylase family 4
LRVVEKLSKADDLKALQDRVVARCHCCKLRTPTTTIVFADGNPDASLVLVGEGPGAEEDRCGTPFSGPAGMKLNAALDKLGIKRSDIYLTNIILCRTDLSNRTPEPIEWEACRPRLDRQLDIIKPKVILAIGSPAGQALIDKDYKVTKQHGAWSEYRGVPTMGTYHPAYFLHKQGWAEKLPKGSADRNKILAELMQEMKDFLDDLREAALRAGVIS